jgi:uncharacterized protein (DUF1501 family)
MKLSRRTLLAGASSGAFMTSIAPGVRVAMAAEGSSASEHDILVNIYLRGGSDGLLMVAPADDANYQDYRPTIAVSSSGANAGSHLGSLDGTHLFMHPEVPELTNLYTQGDLAIVQAVGIPTQNRSHFVSQDMMERGQADGEPDFKSGWLTRHLNTLGGTRPLLGTISTGYNNKPLSLLACPQAITIPNVQHFEINGGRINTDLIAAINAGSSEYKVVAQQTIEAVNTVQDGLAQFKTGADEDDPGATAVTYPNSPLGNSMQSLATLIKMDVGVDLATVDQGGWDLHEDQVLQWTSLATDLSQSLDAFWTDLEEFQSRVTIVTMTEFGRRVLENTSAGTDHGSASYMFVLSGSANGGQLYGQWPGLGQQDLDAGDLAVSTDYRQVLSELIVKRHGNTALDQVFPTIPYQPLGLVSGDDSAVT